MSKATRFSKSFTVDRSILDYLQRTRASRSRSERLNELAELHVARGALVKDRTAAKNRAKALTLPLLERQNADRLKQVEAQIAAIETEMKVRIEADPDLRPRFAILTSIPGIAQTAALALLVEMPELGALGAGQAVSHAGLAPVARQSGR